MGFCTLCMPVRRLDLPGPLILHSLGGIRCERGILQDINAPVCTQIDHVARLKAAVRDLVLCSSHTEACQKILILSICRMVA